MVVSHRSVRFQADKGRQAREWTSKVAGYLRQEYPKYRVRLLRSVVGDVSTLHWLSEHESLADWERFQKDLEADKGYQGLIAEEANKGWRMDDGWRIEVYETIVG